MFVERGGIFDCEMGIGKPELSMKRHNDSEKR
jgi:hypothetical protein